MMLRARRSRGRLRRARASALCAAIAALGTASLVGCPPSLDDPQAFESLCPAGFSVDQMFQQTCTHVGCHVAGSAAAAGLDLTSPDSFARMYGVPSSECGQQLISANGPGQSLLVAKLEGTAPCGSRMPLGGTPLSASQVACVEQWIQTNIASSGPPPPPPAPDAGIADAQADVRDAGDASTDDAGEDAGSDAADDADNDAGDAGELPDASDAG